MCSSDLMASSFGPGRSHHPCSKSRRSRSSAADGPSAADPHPAPAAVEIPPADEIGVSVRTMHNAMLQVRGMMCKMKGVAKVDGETVAEAEMGAMVRDR